MNILLTGATGFLGRHIAARLQADGHRLRCAVRAPPSAARADGIDYAAIDFTRATDAADWLPLLAGIDVVINAVGILREHGRQRFDLLHRQAPCALFAACSSAGVLRVIQISALGADAGARSAYHLSKRAADDFLLGLPLGAVVVQPSLVFGIEGASTRLFGMLASLPLIPLPGEGRQQVQPVHVEDVAEAVARLVVAGTDLPRRLALVGPRPLAWRDYLATLRAGLGIRQPARFLAVPPGLVRRAAALAALRRDAPVDAETLAMLERGNVADAAPLTLLLGRPPRPPEAFVPVPLAPLLRSRARLQWLLPVLRTSIALVWILTGIVSLGLYPVEASFALLARAGVPAALRPAALHGAAVLDLLLGVLCFVRRGRRAVWWAQAALILGYTAILSVRLPEFWLHPYGPLTKNLPMLAAIWLLHQLEDETWNTRS